jgi:hypothetical protein
MGADKTLTFEVGSVKASEQLSVPDATRVVPVQNASPSSP